MPFPHNRSCDRYCAENAVGILWEYRGQTAENTMGTPRVSYAKRLVYNSSDASSDYDVWGGQKQTFDNLLEILDNLSTIKKKSDGGRIRVRRSVGRPRIPRRKIKPSELLLLLLE